MGEAVGELAVVGEQENAGRVGVEAADRDHAGGVGDERGGGRPALRGPGGWGGEGERVIQEAGGSLIGVYVTLGRYDVVEIFEAPDDDTAAEILLKLQRHGAEHTETLRAFTREEAEAIIRRL